MSDLFSSLTAPGKIKENSYIIPAKNNPVYIFFVILYNL